MNDRKRERVARAICRAAGSDHNGYCVICEGHSPDSCIWQTFLNEADAAIKAVKGF